MVNYYVQFSLSEAEIFVLTSLKSSEMVKRKDLKAKLSKQLKCGKNDNALNQIIFGLRQKLKDKKSEWKIVTHKNMGYSLQSIK